jgi:hypothetical protein
MSPHWLRGLPGAWWALVGGSARFPWGYGLRGSGGRRDPEPGVRVRGRNSAAGPGVGATCCEASVAPAPLFPPAESVFPLAEPAPAASVESREHSQQPDGSSAPATRKRVVLLPHAQIERRTGRAHTGA